MSMGKSILRRLAGEAGLDRVIPRSDDRLSRRALLWGGLSSLTALLGDEARAAPRPSSNRFLVDRLTFGWTPEEQQLVDTLGYHGYLEHHLNPTAINDAACAAKISQYFRLTWPPDVLHSALPAATIHEVIESTVVRSVHGKRQLLERMVEFWTDHFNIDINNTHNPWLFPVWLREVIRPHALGTFPDLLAATAQSASMMFYLDNETSDGANPNENYARELLELHTMGVGSGYTQVDVEEVARCLTGWGVDWGGGEGSTWQFQYFPARHDNGAKVVLGNNIPAGGGFNDGLMVLDILAAHPATANYIARKMCRYFWSYDPSPALVSAVAQTYMNTGGDIPSMLRTLFTTEDPATAPPKLKRPFHLFVSSMRATGTDLTPQINATGSELRNQLNNAGHQPFHHGPPDGYPDSIAAWSNLLLPRWNFGFLLTAGVLTGANFDLAAYLQGATTAAQIADRIDQTFFAGRMPAAEKTAVQGYMGAGTPSNAIAREAIALAMTAPSFQWY